MKSIITIIILSITSYTANAQANTNARAIIDSIIKKMEMGYNTSNYKIITDCYVSAGKVIGKTTEISGTNNLLTYWTNVGKLGGTWLLTNDKTELIAEQIWMKGTSKIIDKNNNEHRVLFTMVVIKENNEWKILQDAFW